MLVWLLIISLNLLGLVWAIIDSIKKYSRSGKKWYLIFTFLFTVLASVFMYYTVEILKQ